LIDAVSIELSYKYLMFLFRVLDCYHHANFHVQGKPLPSGTVISTPMKHTFSLNKESLICEEAIYVSDQEHESHYRQKHAKNKGKRKKTNVLTSDLKMTMYSCGENWFCHCGYDILEK
jgi:hypothetical protein